MTRRWLLAVAAIAVTLLVAGPRAADAAGGGPSPRTETLSLRGRGPGKVELSVDLMRHVEPAPKNAMELLFVHLMR